jgi:hypothetical protein
VQYAASPAPQQQQPAPEQPRNPEHKPQSTRAQHRAAPKPQTEHQSDAQQLPAFLLRPVPLPKTEKPVATPRKKVPVTA